MGRNRRKGLVADVLRKQQKKFSPSKLRKSLRHKEKSQLEETVEGWLREDGIKFKAQFAIGTDPVCHADLLIGKRTVVELHGCYYHGCRICTRRIEPWQAERQKKDGSRYDFFIKQGYDVVVIWEHEVEKEPNRVRAVLRAIAENRGK